MVSHSIKGVRRERPSDAYSGVLFIINEGNGANVLWLGIKNVCYAHEK